jgi:hypothetical protein
MGKHFSLVHSFTCSLLRSKPNKEKQEEKMKVDKLLVILLGMLPYDKLAELIISLLKKLVEKTDNEIDDRLVELLEILINRILNKEEEC